MSKSKNRNDGLYTPGRAQARHYLDPDAKPCPEITCGFAMTWKQHQERTVYTLDEVTCRECHEKLLARGKTIRGKQLKGYFKGTMR